MDEAAKLRAAFIRGQLNRLMKGSDLFKRKSAVREFHRYFEWWGDSLAEDDRRAISEQLSKLETNTALVLPSKGRR